MAAIRCHIVRRQPLDLGGDRCLAAIAVWQRWTQIARCTPLPPTPVRSGSCHCAEVDFYFGGSGMPRGWALQPSKSVVCDAPHILDSVKATPGPPRPPTIKIDICTVAGPRAITYFVVLLLQTVCGAAVVNSIGVRTRGPNLLGTSTPRDVMPRLPRVRYLPT